MNYISHRATLSPCGGYRYHLERTWDLNLPRLCWIMLNPSTADAAEDDATIRVCVGRARRMACGGIDVVNLFALRSTDPGALYTTPSPVSASGYGVANEGWVFSMAGRGGYVICAWGNHGAFQGAGRKMLENLRGWSCKPLALKLTKAGHPCHPLRISYDTVPFPI